jgi:hypothetical protein
MMSVSADIYNVEVSSADSFSVFVFSFFVLNICCIIYAFLMKIIEFDTPVTSPRDTYSRFDISYRLGQIWVCMLYMA